MTIQENNNAFQNGEKAPALWGWHTYLSIAITIVILVALAAMVDLKKVWHEFAVSDKTFVLLGMLAHYATYPVRGLRWRRCLTHLPVKGDGAKFGLLVFFYNFVDNLVPAKMGDVYGAHLARINCGIRRSAAMGSIVFLRMIDAWVVLLLAGAASWLLFAAKLPPSVFWALIGGGIIALAATLIMLTFLFLKRSVPRWLPDKIQKMIYAFHTGMWPSPRELLPISGLTALVWVLEILWIFFLTKSFGLRLDTAELVFLTMIPLLASAFPLTPSGAGVVELTLFSCLRVVGIPGPLAVSVTVVNRFIDYWLHIGLGLLAWAVRRKLGLRTWREVPVQASEDAATPKTWVRQEDLS
jgi:uncharacterized protein (TIRG00374 family)